jgi:hypothetical protein
MSSLSDFDPTGDSALTTLDPGDFFTGRGGRALEESARRSQAGQIGELRRQFDLGQQRLEPTFAEAVPAFQRQSALSGAQGADAQGLALSQRIESPDTEFQRQQGLRLLSSGAASTGGLGGGDRLRNLTRLGTDLASRGLQNDFNRLGVVSGAGQGAGNELVGLGSRFAGNVAGVNQAGAQGRIDAIQDTQQQRSQNVQGGLGLLSALSDEAKKENVRDLSSKECFDLVATTPLKAWTYLKECGIDEKEHFGPMYQESPDCIKTQGEKSLQVHDELWLIAGALKHVMENRNDAPNNQ